MNPVSDDWSSYKHRVLGDLDRHGSEMRGLREAFDEMRDAIPDKLTALEKASIGREEVEIVRRRVHELGDLMNHRLGFAEMAIARLEGIPARVSECETTLAGLTVRAGFWGAGLGAISTGLIWVLTYMVRR